MSSASCPALPDFASVPDLPREGEEAVFSAPWEAKAFALVVHLHQRGAFAWSDWVSTLSAEIAADKMREGETPYYLLWLSAAEKLVTRQGLVAEQNLQLAREALHAAQGQAHDHAHDHHHHHHDHDDHDHHAHGGAASH